MANPHRLALIDIARSAALLAMIGFHICFDLVLFGLITPDITQSPAYFWAPRLVAGSFMGLAGLSLWLGHGAGLRWGNFRRRMLRLAAAAALVSAASYGVMPQAPIFFGVLHSIALGSLVALPFLRLPAPVTIAAGAAVLFCTEALRAALQWNFWGLRWLGLHDAPTQSMDFLPIFPWFGLMLIGLGLGRAGKGLWSRPAKPTGPVIRALAWPGRHSLAIYLIHQPLLFSLFWLYLRAG